MGPVPSVGLTLTWFIWDRNLALHVTLHSLQLVVLMPIKLMHLKKRKNTFVFKPNVTRAIIKYYDFETRTDIDADGSKYYTPNCCVLQLATPKENGKHDQITFMGDDCVEKLMDIYFFSVKKACWTKRGHVSSLHTMLVVLTGIFYYKVT